MAKIPEAGKVKTRLQPILNANESAELAKCFLQDTENKANSISGNVFMAITPLDESNKLDEILQHKPLLFEQTGEDLGERMFNAFKLVLNKGFDAVVMIGTDSPTFPADFIEQTFEFLELETDIVLGKTEDGGFYLIGVKDEIDERIFENVAWSSDKTFEKVWENIMNLNLHLREVPSWYDVDEPKDLERLKNELLNNENANRRASKTFEFIKKW